jgi:hypothetical protein
MVESVALANRLHELESNGFHEVRATFEQYQENMEPLARRVLQLSRRLDSTFTEQASPHEIEDAAAVQKSNLSSAVPGINAFRFWDLL